MLLCQERFLARLGSIPEGRAFIWKGGSLIVRLYRTVAIPRYTIDVDLTVGGISSDSVRGVLEKAMRIDLGDGFVFTGITAHSMERDTPYGGERFELDWRFFSKGSSRKLRIDACAGDVVDPTTIGSREVFLLPFGSENIELKVHTPSPYLRGIEVRNRGKGGSRECQKPTRKGLRGPNLTSKKIPPNFFLSPPFHQPALCRTILRIYLPYPYHDPPTT